jgi:RND family efflux transporter MFP subunit
VGQNAEAVASIQVAEASIAQAKLDLEFAKIAAPIGGRISRAIPSVGDLITPTTGTLTSIVSVDPIHLYFDMDEPTLLTLQKRVREGVLEGPEMREIPLLLGLANDDGYPYRGKLDFVENKIDPNTGTVRVRGVFANPKPKRGPRTLAPGFFARVRLPLGEPHKALLISERAIGRDQGQSFVYVVSGENEVVYRKVKLGPLHEGMRVISDGLTAGERIVVNGLQRVRPGSKVDPHPPEAKP